MKRIVMAALFLILLAGCGSGPSRRLDALEAKNELLSARVKSLEDQLLASQKQLIAHQLAMQTIRERQREMEGYFDRLQVSQSR